MLPSNLTKLRLPVHKSSIISDKVNGTETAIIGPVSKPSFAVGQVTPGLGTAVGRVTPGSGSLTSANLGELVDPVAGLKRMR